jgi:hypothetical protein
MINEAQDQRLANNVARSAKYKQDKTNPMVININDGRLMPNNKVLREHPDYRVYTGDIKADQPARMRWLKGFANTPKVVNSAAAADAFDVGKATKEDLVGFALDTFGAALDGDKHIATLRKEVMALYEAMNAKQGEGEKSLA